MILIRRNLHINYLFFRAGFAREIDKYTDLRGSRILIIAPHPDDEVIGCGGLITRLVAENTIPHIIVMTGGESSLAKSFMINAQDIVTARRGLTRIALGMLGVPEDHLHELNFPDGGISEDSSEVEKLRMLIEVIRPDYVFVPHWGEGWSDHIQTAKIVKKICGEHVIVWEYCVWMQYFYNARKYKLDWKHAAILQMSPIEHKTKLLAMDAYTKPKSPSGCPWSGALPKFFMRVNQGNKELYFLSQID